MKFVLFPMFHVASPAFYADVRTRLKECDVIVAEGLRGKSRQASTLTLAYRLAPRRRRNGLEEQKNAALLPAGVPVINADVTAAESIADLRRLPRWMYLLLLLSAPVMGLVFAWRGPRAFFDEDLVVEDLPSTRRAEARAEGPIRDALSSRRDQMLLDALGKIHADRGDEAITVAVVYGAGHIPAVTAGLRDRYGYRPRGAEWLTIYVPE
ncbi:hypothetical protein [Actinomadura alba]|uniref:TraB family protein n=1 Tax=Actinomadura alba TaxID=406431 RepID=A0ABR7LLK4_9ACTN|nr:hypothetical protein [Actinomadura alba]MBC6465268.1 hypothetical protein [Actinomadura alba]